MILLFELIKFLFYSFLIVSISKYILVPVLRKFAQTLNLKAKTVGNIAGFATSMPELLSVSFASLRGLVSTSIYNILSSNIINLVQYLYSIFINRNQIILKNKALQVDIILVLLTIILPIFLIIVKIQINLGVVLIFIFLLISFYYINNNAHKLYLKIEDAKSEEIILEEGKWVKGKKKVRVKYLLYLTLIGIALFISGNLLSNSLEKLAIYFKISQTFLGILLGIITSIPELITFFESQKHYNKKENRKLGVVEATNNLLTSNMLNLFVIQSIGIIIYEIFTT